MIDVVWGSAKDKPESSRILAEAISGLPERTGYLYIGYPVIGTPTGPMKFDALLVSKELGLVAFDLVEGMEVGEFRPRQDDIATFLEVKLKPYSELKEGRNLKFVINVITFAPAKATVPPSDKNYFVATTQSLGQLLNSFNWGAGDETFARLVAAVQVVTSIRAGRKKREPQKPNSRGARLKQVEDSIANLDQHQSQAVIETVDGIQRIRGLAGSGKTIVLALKVAYLHAQNDEWRIAVTFNTRSLKEQFKRLINNFTIEQTGSEPDWEKVDILNAWGGPGDRERDGIYHKYCREHGIPFIDFRAAKSRFGEGKEFAGVCSEALVASVEEKPLYDVLLVDEAQDLPPEFLRLCYRFLKKPKRLVYAYDELQSLTGDSVLPPEDLFGKDSKGEPLVRLNLEPDLGPRQDIILEKCYRNSRPLLATAHALGFGIYRKLGLVQFFEQDALWSEVGYVVEAGVLEGGQPVTLSRTSETSPRFLEDHSPPDDLIQFFAFESTGEQRDWVVEAIRQNIQGDELRPEDVVVINPNPLSTQKELGPVREQLLTLGINSELAGVSTSTDVFTRSGAITFTGIFRAKGNEAGMVYIVNAQDCFSSWSKGQLALVRNRLFTAITRSKAWVRVLGIGEPMRELIREWQALRDNKYKLSFRYPTDEEKHQLRLINVEPAGRRNRRLRQYEIRTKDLLSAVEEGDIDADQLIEDVRRAKAASKPK